MPAEQKQRFTRAFFRRLVTGYVAFAALWFAAIGYLADRLVAPDAVASVQTAMSWVFVGVTAVILYIVLHARARASAAESLRAAGARAQRLVLITATLALLTAGWFVSSNLYQGRVDALHRAENTNATFARILEEHIAGLVTAVDIALLFLIHHSERPYGKDALQAFAEEARARIGAADAVVVLDSSGRRIAAADPQRLVDSSGVAGDCYRFHRERGRGLYVSRSQDPEEGRGTLIFCRRITGPDGELDGIALVAVELSYFHRLYAALRLGQGRALVLLSRSGHVLVRAPALALTPPSRLTTAFVSKAVSGQASGNYRGLGLDRVERLISYRSVDSLPLVVLVTISEKDVLRPWYASMASSAAAAIVSLLVLLWLLSRTLRELSNQRILTGKLQQSEARLATAQRVSHVGSWALEGGIEHLADLRQAPVTWSDETYRILGYEPGAVEVTGDTFLRAVDPDDVARVRKALGEAVASGSAYQVTCRITRPDRTQRIVMDSGAVTLERGATKPIRMLGTLQDVTEQHLATTALEGARERLQTLSARLIQVQELERSRIARDLHDEVGQSLTLIKLSCQRAIAKPDGGVLHLSTAIELVDQTLAQVRNIALSLRPAQLDDLGLLPALRWLLRIHSQNAGLDCELEAPSTLQRRLAPDLETGCYRIAQEALTNAARHAGASLVQVGLTVTPSTIELKIQDNGRGFDAVEQQRRRADRPSLGLLSMQERAALLGGRLHVESQEGTGTIVTARLPLRWRDSPD